MLQLACPRKIRFIIQEEYYRNRFLHPILRRAGCIPITATRAKDAVRAAAEKIRAGEVVCLFPEGQLSRSGTLLRLRRGYELIARQADAPVVPVWLDQLWGSMFSYQGGRFFTKWPRELPYHVQVAFGRPLAAKEADIATVREELLKLGETLLQPASDPARTSCLRLPARIETPAMANRGHRRLGSHHAFARQIVRRRDRACRVICKHRANNASASSCRRAKADSWPISPSCLPEKLR